MLKNYSLIFLIILAGLYLRLYKLGENSFWYDESESVLTAIPPNQICSVLYKENYPSVFYKIFVYYWSHLGFGEYVLRLASVIFGVFCIAMIYALTARLFNKSIGLISTFLLSFSPFHIYYSQELRMYTLISFLSLLCIYFLIRALREGRVIFYSGYVICNSLNIYTHPATFILFLCEILFFVLSLKKYGNETKRWLWANLSIAVFLIPWLATVLRLSSLLIMKDPRYFDIMMAWIPAVNFKSLLFTFKNFSVGYNATSLFYIFASIGLFFLFLWGTIKMEKENRILLLSCLLIPIFGSFLISKFRNCYVDRYFIASSIFFYIIIANGIYNCSRKLIFFELAVILATSILALGDYFSNELTKPSHWRVGVETRKNYRDGALYILKNMQENDIVFHTCRNTLVPFQYYFNYRFKDVNRSTNAEDKNNLLLLCSHDGKLQAFEYLIPYYGILEVDKKTVYSAKRIWLVFSEWHFGEKDTFKLQEWRVVEWLDRYLVRKSFSSFKGMNIYLYEKSDLLN